MQKLFLFCIFSQFPNYSGFPHEPRHEKTGFLYMRKQRRRSTAKLISAFVFATRIVQSLFYLNPKFQAYSHLLWLYSPVCVGPGRKPRRPVFSERGSLESEETELILISKPNTWKFLSIIILWLDLTTNIHQAILLFFIKTKIRQTPMIDIHYDNTPMQYTSIFTTVQMIIFRWIIVIFFLFLHKTSIVGTR